MFFMKGGTIVHYETIQNLHESIQRRIQGALQVNSGPNWVFKNKYVSFTTISIISSIPCVSYCKDVNDLMKLMRHNHKSEEQRLFTDASKVSLKGVLLLTESEFPTEPDFHAAQMKK
jgi:hypothetical protein